MPTRRIIQILIATCVILLWLGLFLFQMLNIYPYNNWGLIYSSSGLICLVILLAIHDWIKYKSLIRILDVFPNMQGESPSFKEWISRKTWLSLPKWIVALTVISICIFFVYSHSETFPDIDAQIAETMKTDSISNNRIGKIEGFSFFRSWENTNSQNNLPARLSVRVYGEKGNFPLEVSVESYNDRNIIKRIRILQ